MKFLEHESEELLEDLDIKSRLVGWEKLIIDKILRNELMDIKSINIP